VSRITWYMASDVPSQPSVVCCTPVRGTLPPRSILYVTHFTEPNNNLLHSHGTRDSLQCSPEASQAWCAALRSEELSLLSLPYMLFISLSQRQLSPECSAGPLESAHCISCLGASQSLSDNDGNDVGWLDKFMKHLKRSAYSAAPVGTVLSVTSRQ
jgi:hypothetical protein